MQTLTATELADQFIELQQKRQENPDEYRGFQTHIPELNEILGGIHPGWYIVLGGAQKSGKSAFAVSLLAALANRGRKVLPVSLEMNNMEIAGRLFANISGVPTTKFRDITLTDEDWVLLHRAKERISQYNAIFNYGAYYIEDVVELAHKYRPDVLFVDYVQLMSSRQERGKRNAVLEHISRKLKQLTLMEDHRMAVVALLQLNQEFAKAGKFDTPYGFHGSAAFKNDADVAMTLAPVEDPSGEVSPEYRDIHIVASRHSANATFRVYFGGARSLVAGAVPEDDPRYHGPNAFVRTLDLNKKVEAVMGIV